MLLVLLACAPKSSPASPHEPSSGGAEGLKGELVVEGPLEARVASGDGASVVLFYGGEQRGSLEPCGCPTRPRGGLPRQAAYTRASVEANPDALSLVLNGGYWLEDAMSLDGTTRADVPVLNRWMVDGLALLHPGALNVAYNDMAGITSLDGQVGDLPMVSANVRGQGVLPYRIIEGNGVKVGVTGITAQGITFLDTPGFEVAPPYKAAQAVLEELDPQVDLVVLLAYQSTDAAKKLARDGHVDVIVDTDLHREFYEPFWQDGAIWVRSHYMTMRLGELRIGLQDGRVAWAVDRKIDLDSELPSEPELLGLSKRARKEIDKAQKDAFGTLLGH